MTPLLSSKSLNLKDYKKGDDKTSKVMAGGDDGLNGRSDSYVQDLTNRYYRAVYSKLLADEIGTRTQNSLFLNLLYRTVKSDPSEGRAFAFLKRFMVMATHCSAPVAAALLLVVSEVCKERRELIPALSRCEDDVSGKVREGGECVERDEDDDGGGDGVAVGDWQQLGNYNADKREPLFSVTSVVRAHVSLWEVSLFRTHVHPSVSAFANSLCTPPEHAIVYSGDPTVDFNLTSFLNRFAYKNPKRLPSDRTVVGVGDKEGDGKGAVEAPAKHKRERSVAEVPINTVAFEKMTTSDVAPEKLFFYKYFTDRNRLLEMGKVRERRRARKGEDDGDEEDEEDMMDRFADKLAEDMLRSGDGVGPDIDDEDEDEDFGMEPGGAGQDDDVDWDMDAVEGREGGEDGVSDEDDSDGEGDEKSVEFEESDVDADGEVDDEGDGGEGGIEGGENGSEEDTIVGEDFDFDDEEFPGIDEDRDEDMEGGGGEVLEFDPSERVLVKRTKKGSGRRDGVVGRQGGEIEAEDENDLELLAEIREFGKRNGLLLAEDHELDTGRGKKGGEEAVRPRVGDNEKGKTKKMKKKEALIAPVGGGSSDGTREGGRNAVTKRKKNVEEEDGLDDPRKARKTKRVQKGGGGEEAFAFADASLFEVEVEAIVNRQKDLERGALGTITGSEARMLAGEK
eukprot:gene1154-1300_t